MVTKKVLEFLFKNWLFFFCLLSVLVYSVHYFPLFKFEEGAYFGGDTWAYQSWAVNFIKGHGLRFGGIESYDTYRFSPGYGAPHNAGIEGYEYFMKVGKGGGIQDFWGTPGYSVFLGVVYKIFGINPGIAKQVQLLLIIVVGSFLPWLGYMYWRRLGFLSGVIGGACFLNRYAVVLPKDILTEPFIVFMIFLTIIYTMVWEKNKTWFNALILGVIISYDLLVKGSLIYVSLMYVMYFVVLWWKKTVSLFQVVLLLVGIFSIAGSWSVYGSTKLGRPVILTTQDELIVTMGNNERSINGEPYMVLPGDDSYYNKPEVVIMPLYWKVITFYLTHREIIPEIFANKVKVSFEGLPFFKILVFGLIFDIWWKVLFLERKSRVVGFFLVVLLSLGLLFVYSVWTKVTFLAVVMNSPVLLLTLLISVTLLLIKRRHIAGFPFPLAVFVINFILITLMTFGFSRYVGVISFITILGGIYYLLLFLIRFYKVMVTGVSGIKEDA